MLICLDAKFSLMADLPNELLFNAFLSTGNKDEESRMETELGSDEEAQE